MAQAPRKAGGRNAPPVEDKPARGRSVAKQTGSKEITNWDEEFARQAEEATAMEKGAPMGRSFSFKGGQMTFDGAPVKDNKAVVIIAAACIEKAYYEGLYDPDLPEPPVCFAFDTDPDALAPIPEDVADLQNDICETCQWNKFGSADRGKGKACKDVRRLALIPAGQIAKNGDIELVEDVKSIEKAEFGFAKLPPTSLTPYSAFVRQVASTMKRPPHGIYAIMECRPDPKNQFVVTFEPIDLIDAKLLGAVMKRHDEAVEAIMQPYTYLSDDEKASRAAERGGRGGGRQSAGGRGGSSRQSASGGRGKAAAGGTARGRKY